MRSSHPVSLALAASLMAAASVSQAAGECSGATQVVGAALSTLLNSQIVCAHRIGGAADPMLRWSELHNGDGTAGAQILGEQGLGSTDPAGTYDADIGTWQLLDSDSSGGVDQVQYYYTDDGTYTHTLWLNGTTYYFCDTAGGADADAQVKTIAAIPAATVSGVTTCGW